MLIRSGAEFVSLSIYEQLNVKVAFAMSQTSGSPGDASAVLTMTNLTMKCRFTAPQWLGMPKWNSKQNRLGVSFGNISRPQFVGAKPWMAAIQLTCRERKMLLDAYRSGVVVQILPTRRSGLKRFLEQAHPNHFCRVFFQPMSEDVSSVTFTRTSPVRGQTIKRHSQTLTCRHKRKPSNRG